VRVCCTSMVKSEKSIVHGVVKIIKKILNNRNKTKIDGITPVGETWCFSRVLRRIFCFRLFRISWDLIPNEVFRRTREKLTVCLLRAGVGDRLFSDGRLTSCVDLKTMLEVFCVLLHRKISVEFFLFLHNRD
jgi:hypothetical protein